MDRPQNPRPALGIAAVLVAVTLALFWPVTGHDFISYDDGIYITDNPHVLGGLKIENVTWAFRTGQGGNWHPVTWISHMLDVQLFGTRAGWHHLVSAVLHAANAGLLFWLLNAMTGARWRSAFVAALFAWHPLHVESVAWAAERKDVLSTFFGLLSLLAYVRRARGLQEARLTPPPSQGGVPVASIEAGTTRNYYLALLFFALSLLSKPMLVTLPFLLLLLDYWPLRRLLPGANDPPTAVPISLPQLLLEKLPFFALSLGSSVATLAAQKQGGAVAPVQALGLPERIANAVTACAAYLRQTIWPADLALFYPLRAEVPIGDTLMAGALLLVISGWAVLNRRSRPWLLVGWFWFLGMLVPVIGIVQVGMQQRADRYTYLPIVGIFILAACEIPERLRAWRPARHLLAVLAAALLLGCGVATSRQLSYWQDSENLFGRTLMVTRDNYIALYNHGLAVYKKGRLEEAIQDYQTAVNLAPHLDPARVALGEALGQQGKFEEAVEQFQRVLEIQPDHAAARSQLGVVLGRQGRLEAAAEAFSMVLQQHPEDVAAHNNLGNVLTLQGRLEDAEAQFAEAVRLQPNHSGAHNNLAIACKKLGRTAEAVMHYRQAIRLKPDSLEALNNLAWVLAADPEAANRNGAEAVELATHACVLTRYQHPTPMTTLAAAYGETGLFSEAIAFAERAKEAAGGQGAAAERLDEMLGAFRAGKPFRSE